MEKSQVTQEKLHSEESKIIGIRDGGGRTAKKHEENEATEKSRKQFQAHQLPGMDERS
jgi:hypothetical protein